MTDGLRLQAISFIKSNKKLLLDKFANDDICKVETNPISIFMAGSPGAGKTEFSKNFLKVTKIKAVRIDADEIKDIIPQYNKKNSSQIQGASALGVEYLFDYVLKAKKSVILDGTFADYEKACKNVQRSIKRGRHTEIYYLYQEPPIAWQFTQARERLEGRFVPKEMFIHSLLNARENVKKIKEVFGSKVKVNVVIKNFENREEKTYLDIKSIDVLSGIGYDYESLIKML